MKAKFESRFPTFRKNQICQITIEGIFFAKCQVLQKLLTKYEVKIQVIQKTDAHPKRPVVL